MFKVNDNGGTGFHIVFGNGWTASVQWGRGTLSENRFGTSRTESADAEVAAWDKDGNWYSFGDDNVRGWCTPEEVASFLQMVSSFGLYPKTSF